ncbi:hypothetical protein SAY87_014282 [Trapa incisa]|uniref:Uncharacterized protein n=1 Tax=Trapa incisa TaxID=236973 RepID=A0AAN7JD90_9MYRT|nr:hypothetical protein SAY87_014282 [Trapa incisa]
MGAVHLIFLSLNQSESISHLMKPARLDQSWVLQQMACYQKEKSWSTSVSWGCSARHSGHGRRSIMGSVYVQHEAHHWRPLQGPTLVLLPVDSLHNLQQN